MEDVIGTRIVLTCILALAVLYTGCGESKECADDGDCDVFNGEYCAPSGTCQCLWWENRTITFYVNENCSSDMPVENCLAAVQSAADYWNTPECSDIEIVLGGTTPREDVGFDYSGSDNINLLIWIESSWQIYNCPGVREPCRDPRSVALVTTAYNDNTGQVFDADIELNGDEFDFTESTLGEFLIEEFGHVIGVRDIDSLCTKFPTGEPCPCADEVVR
jgi:hypothetical protein